jgi:hypothetical protein
LQLSTEVLISIYWKSLYTFLNPMGFSKPQDNENGLLHEDPTAMPQEESNVAFQDTEDLGKPVIGNPVEITQEQVEVATIIDLDWLAMPLEQKEVEMSLEQPEVATTIEPD